jgi:hypothetical protein
MKSDTIVMFIKLVISGYIRMNEDKFGQFLVGKKIYQYCKEEVETVEIECDLVRIFLMILMMNRCRLGLWWTI